MISRTEDMISRTEDGGLKWKGTSRVLNDCSVFLSVKEKFYNTMVRLAVFLDQNTPLRKQHAKSLQQS